MIPKSEDRFSDKIMLHQVSMVRKVVALKQMSMIPKSGGRFSEKIMPQRTWVTPAARRVARGSAS
jgi:hypothetical protein